MKRILLFCVFSLFALILHAQTTKVMWVGESYSCNASSAVVGLTSDVSWSNSGGYISMSGSGFYRTIKVTQYFKGTASVTCRWKYRLTSTSKWQTGSRTWNFTCNDNPASIYPSSLELSPGEQAYVSSSLTYHNSYTSYANIYYASSNSKVVDVTSDGLVTAVAPGKAYINLYSKVSGNSPSCLVTVKDVAVQNVSITSAVSLIAGETCALRKEISPNNAMVNSIQWYSNDVNIAAVNNGTVIGVKHGTTSVYCVVNGTIRSNNCFVTVEKPKLKLASNVEAGLVERGTEVELTSSADNARIYYTLNGSTPSSSSMLYSSPIVLKENCTLKAIAYHTDYLTSDIISYKYDVTSLKSTGEFNRISQFTLPYVGFNDAIEKSDAFNSITLTIEGKNVLDKCIIKDKWLLVIPKKDIPLDNQTAILTIPENSLKLKNGDCNKSMNLSWKTEDITVPYSHYATDVYAGDLTSSYLSNKGGLYYWGAFPNSQGGCSYSIGKDWSGWRSWHVRTSCRSKNCIPFVTEDGKLYIWGSNNNYNIGDGSYSGYYEHDFPYCVAINHVKQVACGGQFGHTLALTEDGKLYGWGSNNNKQLLPTDKSLYEDVTLLMDDVRYINANDQTSFVIKNDGSLWGWGRFHTPSRSGSYTLIDTPLKIADNAILVSSNGGETPSYITSNGTLYICDDYFNPIKISEEVVDVSGGYLRGMYVKKDGSLMSWGRNDCGQLGNGTVTAFSKSTSPQQAVKVMDDVTKVSTSWSYSLAIKNDGSVWGWGDNRYGNINPETRNTQEKVTSPELIWESTAAANISKIAMSSDISVGENEIYPVMLHIYPMNSACKRVKWTVDNPNIASVDERGIVKGIKQGVTSVIVEVEGYDGNVFKATCQVNVTKGNRRFFYYIGSRNGWTADNTVPFVYSKDGNYCSLIINSEDEFLVYEDESQLKDDFWINVYGIKENHALSGFLTKEAIRIHITKPDLLENAECEFCIYPTTMKYEFIPRTDTGINGVEIVNNKRQIFNIMGQKMNTLVKGINIVNGKKLMVP